MNWRLLAGNAIAGERADRSAELIAYLPVNRWPMIDWCCHPVSILNGKMWKA